MSLLRQVLGELYSMFAADVAMSVGAVAIVLAAYVLHVLASTPPTLLGFGVLVGCVALLIARVFAFGRGTNSK